MLNILLDDLNIKILEIRCSDIEKDIIKIERKIKYIELLTKG